MWRCRAQPYGFTKVAAAHKEDGQEVSPPEQAALDEIGARLEA